MNILFTCNEYPPFPYGGLGIFVKEIAETLTGLGHKVFVFGFYTGLNEPITEIINGVTVYRHPYPLEKSGLINAIKNRVSYAQYINKLKVEKRINVIEVHDTGGWFLFIKGDFFVRLHNGERYFKKRGLVTNALEIISFLFRKTILISVSHYNKELFKRHFKLLNPLTKVKVIYNGISNNPLEKIESKSKHIVYAGTIKPIKGIDVLLNAFIKSKLYENGYTLHLYGKDTQYNESLTYFHFLKTTIPNLTNFIASGFINYHGVVDKPKVLSSFKSASLCVFPSYYESFGLVVIEAMSMGSIVIYSKQGASLELVDDQINGFLFSPGNVEELAQKMTHALHLDDGEKKRICTNALIKASQFNIKKTVEKTLRLYNGNSK